MSWPVPPRVTMLAEYHALRATLDAVHHAPRHAQERRPASPRCCALCRGETPFETFPTEPRPFAALVRIAAAGGTPAVLAHEECLLYASGLVRPRRTLRGARCM
jgi:hypothetical protein